MDQAESPREKGSYFESQFSQKKELESSAGKMPYIEIESDFSSPQDKTPLVVFPGWSITLATEKPLLRCLSEGRNELEGKEGEILSKTVYGRNLIACEFPRHGGEATEKDGIATEVVRQAELMSDLLLQQEEKVDISADSMASMSLIAAMKLHPEILDKIRNILMVSPAGISGDDNLLRLVGRSLIHFAQDGLTFAKSPIERRNILKMGLEAGLYVGKNPKRTVKEVAAIAKSEEYAALKSLKSDLDAKDIRLGFIQAESDMLTPAENLWSKIGEDAKSTWKELAESDYDSKFTPSLIRPDGLREDPPVNVHDMTDEEKETVRQFFRDKEALNRELRLSGNIPPFDSITMVGGGHDNRLYAQKDYGIKILRAFEELEKMKSSEELPEAFSSDL